MAELKTRKNDAGVIAFIDALPDEQTRSDCHTLIDIMREATGAEPVMWGGSIVGFGDYHYKYASGREGDWFLTGFSPRKQNLSLYIMSGFREYDELMAQLGKYKTGVSCLYVRKLADIDLDVLRRLVRVSVDRLSGKSGA